MNEILAIFVIFFVIIIGGTLLSIGIAAGATYYSLVKECWSDNSKK